MKPGDYKTSGILQDYCLGLLSNQDEMLVEAMCQKHPLVARELKELRQALESYAGSKHIISRDELRKAVWERIKQMLEAKDS